MQNNMDATPVRKITAIPSLNKYEGNALALGDAYNYTFVFDNKDEKLAGLYMHITPRHFEGRIVAVGQTLMAHQLASYTITEEDWVDIKETLNGIFMNDDIVLPIEEAVKEVIANGGKLPCEFWTPPEGTILEAGNPIAIIKSTYAPFMVAFFEAVFQRMWYMIAVASRVDQYLTIIDAALHKSVDDDMIEIIRPSRIHGFGFRSTGTDEQGIKGGLAAILAGLKGTDDVGSVLLARQLMPDIDPATGKIMTPANSVPAAAHVVAMSQGNGVDNQVKVMQNMFDYYAKMPFKSFPIDTSGDEGAREIIRRWCSPGSLREEHLKTGNTLVFRPDSAAKDPLTKHKLDHAYTVLTYFLEAEAAMVDLTDAGLGITKNKKGYKLFPRAFAWIYGDSLTTEDMQYVVDTLHAHGWSIQNIVFGIGGNMLQKDINRGWQDVSAKISQIKFTNKHTGELINRDVCKTATGKVSFQGEIKLVNRDGKLVTVPVDDGDDKCIMVCYYKDGKVLRSDTVEQVRAVVKSYRGF
jgi:nicotinamide phosphoribosyltransferase